MFINNQYIFILISYIFNFKLFYLSFMLIFFYFMDKYEREQTKKIDAMIKAWTYFYKDFVTGDAKCKICYLVIKTNNQSTGLLQLHLQQAHAIDFEKIFIKDDSVKSLNPQLLPSLGTLAPPKTENSLNFLNLPNGQHDWLSPFIEQVSQEQSLLVDQDKDEFKFIIHSTQFTDPLKYRQFNRYSEEQLAQIREQMSQFTNFSKTPAMVTLAQKQLFQSSIKVKKRPLQVLQQIIGKVRQNYDIYQWRTFQQADQKEGQTNIKQSRDKLSKQEYLQNLTKKGYEVIQIRRLKKQNDKQRQMLFQEKEKENKKIQISDNSQNLKECRSYIILNQKMKHYYSRYADSVSIVAFEAKQYIILLFFVQDWRSNYQNVGIIIFEELQIEVLKISNQFQANFAMYFHSISSNLPKRISFLSFLSQNQRNNNIFCHIKDAFSHFNQEFSSSGQNFIHCCEIKFKQNDFSENKKKKKKNAELIYQKFQEKIAQKIEKYSEQLNELRSIEIPVIFSQLAIKSIQDKIRNHKKHIRDSKKQLAMNMKIKDYINPQSSSQKYYHGFITQKKSLKSLRNIVKIYVQMVDYQQSNLGFILDTIFNVISCNRYYQIGVQVEISLANKQMPNQIKQLQSRLSPNIMQILYEIYRQSQSITHLTYRTSTLIDVYSVIIGRQDEILLEQDKIDIVQSNPTKLRAFKNTLFYNDSIRAWVCNCHRITLYGLPCYHIMKVVEKMKGSIYYYINQRWKPDYNDLLLLKTDYDQWGKKSQTKNSPIRDNQ